MPTPKFIAALKGERHAVPPMWFMRQAGRYLPEYRAVRAEAGGFLDLCYDPERASVVTLQPIERFDVDAAILFADILLLPHALGQTVVFESGEGPKLSPPTTAGDLEAFAAADVHDRLGPVYETVKKTRAGLAADKALIGFAGAPWTVATYMLAGGPLKDPTALRAHVYRDRGFVDALLDLLVERTIAYLSAQIDAGVDAVQLFDTWAGGLPGPVLDVVGVKPTERIAAALKDKHPEIPFIAFPKGVGEKASEYLHLRGVDALGIDHALDPAWARATLSPHLTVQGGLDPMLTVVGGEAMEKAATRYLRLFHDAPYVFNLGHGFTPDTPPDNVKRLVDFVRGRDWA